MKEQMKEETKKQTIVNGVNVDDFNDTVKAIKKQPEIAKFNFRAANKWHGGSRSRTTVDEYYGAQQNFKRDRAFVLELDEPPVLLGEDKAANPVEYVFVALAGCLTTSLVYHAAAMGIELEEVESAYEGNLDLQGFLGLNDQIRNGYENLSVTFKIKAKNAPEEKLQELVRIAQQRSPVFDIVSNGVPVSVRLAE